jgi:3-hydroxyacyl-[acyl-carrier-protein] dehydratase
MTGVEERGMTTETHTVETLDLDRIMKLLPHRYPFLMVDRIVDIRGDEFCRGIKNVTINEPHFQGHFPNRPIMPGVLLIEGMAQTAGAMCILNHGAGSPRLVYFMSIDKARFRKPVVPGDIVEFHMSKIRSRKTIWKYSGLAKVGETVVAEAEVCAMMMDE